MQSEARFRFINVGTALTARILDHLREPVVKGVPRSLDTNVCRVSSRRIISRSECVRFGPILSTGMSMTASTVYFATNRPPSGPTEDVASYGTGIQPPSDSTGLVYGTAFITGLDVATNVQGAVGSISNVSIGGFSDEAIGDLANAGRNLLVFIHGFDNTFSDALTRAAFNGEWLSESHDQAAEMSVIAFSWPSLGRLIDGPVLPDAYKRDQAMARLSGQQDVVIGTPAANRSRLEIEKLIGFFVNTLAVRLDVAGSARVASIL